MRFRRSLILAVIGVFFLAVVAGAEGKRFEGYASGSTGPDHNFVVGDGFTLVFIDQKDSFTPYRVCWHRLHHSHHRCWFGETGRAGSKDRIFTAAPSSVGTYIIKWTVNHRRKALWRFHNGVGD